MGYDRANSKRIASEVARKREEAEDKYNAADQAYRDTLPAARASAGRAASGAAGGAAAAALVVATGGFGLPFVAAAASAAGASSGVASAASTTAGVASTVRSGGRVGVALYDQKRGDAAEEAAPYAEDTTSGFDY